MFAKVDNGILILIPQAIELPDGRTISGYNLLPEEELRLHGWKDYTEVPMPAPEDGYYWTVNYIDDGTTITPTWVKVELPATEPDLVDKIEDIGKALDMLLDVLE